MRNNVLLLCLGFVFVSCHKEEIPIPGHDAGDALEVQIAMGQDYQQQLFYRLEDNQIVSSNPKSDWDLSFESADTGWHITLNSSRGMAVHRSQLAFADLTSAASLDWNWDVQSGNLDSTAIGSWQTDAYLYVIDMGYTSSGAHMGYKKMYITAVSATQYSIAFGALSDLTPQTITVAKNTANLFTYFKFDTGVVTIAPPNETWDLEFTQYTHLFYDPLEAYVVTGVLLNRYQTKAARISDKPFSEIEYDDISSLTFSSQIDYIGYNWKEFDYTNMIYAVDPSITYIVHTNQGYYYKLHFIDFYNNAGEKGYPKLEIQQL